MTVIVKNATFYPIFTRKKNQQRVYGTLHLVKSTHYGIYCVCIIIIFTKKYFNPFDFFIITIFHFRFGSENHSIKFAYLVIDLKPLSRDK